MRSAWSRNPTPDAALRAALRALLVVVGAVALLAGGLAVAPSADAASATTNRIYKDWQADAEIEACDWTTAQLRAARRDVGDDVEAYAPDFLDAIDDALSARSNCDDPSPSAGGSGGSGSSGSGGGGSTTVAPETSGSESDDGASSGAGASTAEAPAATSAAGATSTATTPTPGPILVPAQKADDAVLAAARTPAGDDGGAAWVWAVLGGAAVLLLLVGWLVRRSGWVPRWAAPATHAVEEAGWRIGNRWSEFGDWIRRGR